MAKNEADYEILPHQLLADLKSEVEALKKKLTQPDNKMNELILEIESMKDSIHELNNIFQQALSEMKEEDATQMLGSINGKLSDVIGQNETIARGMLAISDKVDDFISKQGSPPSSPGSFSGTIKHEMGMPQMGMPGRMAPPPMEAPSFPVSGGDLSGNSDMGFPPPPPSLSASKRKGLFR